MDNISDGLFQGITQFYPGIITIISSLVLMVSLSFKLTLVIVLMTPFCFLIASFITKRSNKMFKEQQKTLGELNGYIEEIVGSQKVVRLLDMKKELRRTFRELIQGFTSVGSLRSFIHHLQIQLQDL